MKTVIEFNGQTFTADTAPSSNRGTVLKINTHDFKLGLDDGTVLTVHRTEMAEPEFAVDDVVEIYRDGREYILRPIDAPTAHKRKRAAHEVNKHVFVWVGAMLFGWLGVDRFLRGQPGMGFFKIIGGPYTLFIWNIVDLGIAINKAYFGPYANRRKLTFNDEVEYLH